ncbi:glycoside hydrolase/deacetylase [Auricularia subglabra TFB-10046 SS5]|nr:glycoside hydrolase/deacetylase [Auricularia subglabra TFB-10046 SS5]
MPTQTTMQPPAVAAGSKPSDIPSAPGMPSLASWWSPDPNTRYPKSDVPPPTDSPEVQGWIDEIAESGIGIPDIKPFILGDAMCAVPENKARIGNDTECWWTCGHCVRATDVTTCNEKFTWGSSFDDGPAPYTPDLLDFLDKNDIKTTFFVVGSRVKDRPAYLQAQYAAGHQIAVHTWSHSSLTTLTTEQIIAELGWTKKIIQDAIGVTPKYMRPPFGDIDDRVRAISMAMGLTPIIWTNTGADSFDTFDWMVQTGVRTAQESLTQFEVILGNATALSTGFIVLQHDLWESQVALAIGYFLPSAIAHTPKLKIQSIRECIGQPAAEVYVETASKKTLPPGNGVGGKVTPGPALKPSDGSSGGDDGGDGGGNAASSLYSAGTALFAGVSALAAAFL